MALATQAPPHLRYNAALAQMKSYAPWLAEIADAAYATAQVETAPGPRRVLLDIADSASEFATRVAVAKPLA